MATFRCLPYLLAAWLGLSGVTAFAQLASASSAPEVQSATRQALETLLGSLAQGESLIPPAATPAGAGATAAPTQAAVPVRQRVQVRPGETLDRVLRRTLSHLPIKDSVLRAAFVEINPDAFVGGSPHRLRGGVELWVPSPEDVRRLILRDSAAPAAARPSAPAPAPSPDASATTAEFTVPDTSDWVRFP